MKIERNFLKIEEVENIASAMLKYSTYTERIICKYMLIMDYCTDEKIEKDENGIYQIGRELFDEHFSNGNIDKLDDEIQNIYIVEKQVKQYESVEHSIVTCIDTLKNYLSKQEKGEPFKDLENLIALTKGFDKNDSK